MSKVNSMSLGTLPIVPIVPNHHQHQSSIVTMEPTKGIHAFGTSSTSNSMTNKNRSNNSKRNDPLSITISPIYSSENYHNDVENKGRGSRRKKASHQNHEEGFGGCETRAFGRLLQTSSATTTSTFVAKHHGWSSFKMRPNPHEKLWNPSPSKKARSTSSSVISSGSGRVVLGEKRIVEGEGGDDGTSWKHSGNTSSSNKENKSRSKYFPNITTTLVSKSSENQQTYSDFIVPQQLSQQTSSADLNNSFTEKISNLDIGFGGEHLAPSTRIQFGHLKEEAFRLSSSDLKSTEVNKENSMNVNNNKNMGSRSKATSSLSSSSSSRCSQFWHEHLDPDYPYITEILNYWHVLEVEHKVDPAYMGKQKEISFKMRTILVDWLVEVIEEYSICNATLHRCVQFVDRFLSKLQISRSNLQLLGTACLFIACKVEEIQPPETGDLVYITDNTYDKSQLLHMECLVLSVLDFDLLTPTAYEFTEYFASVLYLSPISKEFSFYAVELTLLQGEKFLGFSPSIVGLAGVYVGMWCCGDSRHVCVEEEREGVGEKVGSNNKTKAKAHHNKNGMSVLSVLSRIKRLNPNAEFVRSVEEAVLQMFVSILSVTSYNTHSSESNSVCTKYKKFQDQKYFRAATSAAACFSF